VAHAREKFAFCPVRLLGLLFGAAPCHGKAFPLSDLIGEQLLGQPTVGDVQSTERMLIAFPAPLRITLS